MNPHPLQPYSTLFHVIPEAFKMVCITKQHLPVMGEGMCFNSVLIYNKLEFEEIVLVIYFHDGRTSVILQQLIFTQGIFYQTSMKL